jgi:hypothetical protein
MRPMAERRASLERLPFWPRHLSREEAARYVGVCPEVFDTEVAAGLWPAARRRGAKGGRLTWDRCALDATSDRDAGLGPPDSEAAPPVTGIWGERGRGETKGKRTEGRPQKAA